MQKTYTITTLGCKVNQSESESIGRQLDRLRLAPVARGEKADICIINTCTVTGKAAMQSRQAVRRAIRRHPGAQVIVTGCYAEIEPEALRAISGVDDVIGHGGKSGIPRMVEALLGMEPLPVSSDSLSDPGLESVPFPKGDVGGRSRPFLKIQDGCNSACSYCIVPHARGRSRSIHPQTVLYNVVQLAQRGYHEVVLTGIHIGQYGLDLSPTNSLTGLMGLLNSLDSAPRIRLSSIEPAELSDGIIQLIAASDRFCRHLHIPLQSGDDQILRRMQRPYGRDAYRQLVLKVKERLPDAAVGADVLIGFPGESDAAYQNTYDLVAGLPLSYLHVFPFSPREGTPAYRYPGRVPDAVVKERCRLLRELGSMKRRAFHRALLGSTAEIILEDRHDSTRKPLRGMTSNYIPVYVKKDTVAPEHRRQRHALIGVRLDNLVMEGVSGTVL